LTSTVETLAGFRHRFHFILPFAFTEIGSKEVTSVVVHQRVDSRHLLSGQVKVNYLVVDFGELSMITILAFDARLVADSLYPLVIASDRVAITPLFVLPAVSKNVCSTAKQTPEDGNLLFW